jgi:hypothetical protein
LTISPSFEVPVDIDADSQSKPASPGKLNRFTRGLVERGELLSAVNQQRDQRISR